MMREYLFTAILLLTVCTVSPFKIIYPGEITNEGRTKSSASGTSRGRRLLTDQISTLCLEFCLDRKLPDDDVAAVADDYCRAWCRRLPLADALLFAAASVDVGDLRDGGGDANNKGRPSLLAPSSSSAAKMLMNLPNDGGGSSEEDIDDGDDTQSETSASVNFRMPADTANYLPEDNSDDDDTARNMENGEEAVSGFTGNAESRRPTSAAAASSAAAAAAEKRQVDPLLSCIEARCAGMHHSNYPSCVYHKCLYNWKRKRDGSRSSGGGGDGGGGSKMTSSSSSSSSASTSAAVAARRSGSRSDLDSRGEKPAEKSWLSPREEEEKKTRRPQQRTYENREWHSARRNSDNGNGRDSEQSATPPAWFTQMKRHEFGLQDCIEARCRHASSGAPYMMCIQLHCNRFGKKR